MHQFMSRIVGEDHVWVSRDFFFLSFKEYCSQTDFGVAFRYFNNFDFNHDTFVIKRMNNTLDPENTLRENYPTITIENIALLPILKKLSVGQAGKEQCT